MADIQILRETHPDYDAHIDEWKFIKETWKGKSAYIDTHLIQRARENQKDYERRKELAHFENHTRSIATKYLNIFWGGSETVSRTSEFAQFEAMTASIDRTQRDINAFQREDTQWSLLFGWSGTLILQSAGDDRPYWSTVLPEDIRNWDQDADGNLRWLRIQMTERIAPPFAPAFDRTQYLTLFLDGWAIHDERGELVPQEGMDEARGIVPYELIVDGEQTLPIVFTYFQQSDNSILGDSFIYDVARTNRTHFNQTSALETDMRRALNQLLTRKVDPGVEPLDMEILKEANILDYTSDTPPQFASPDVSGWTDAREQIRELHKAMYDIANLEDRNLAEKSESGLAKAMDKSQAEEQIKSWSRNVGISERQKWKISAAWAAQEFEGEVRYPSKFNVLFESDVYESLLKMREAYEDLSTTAVREEAVSSYQQLNPDVEPETMEEIETEIDTELRRVKRERDAIL